MFVLSTKYCFVWGGDLYWDFNLMHILAKDHIPATTSLESSLLNLCKVYTCLCNYDEKEIIVLVWLLGNSPALETMDVLVPPRREERWRDETCKQLLRIMLDSPWASARVRVTKDRSLLQPK